MSKSKKVVRRYPSLFSETLHIRRFTIAPIEEVISDSVNVTVDDADKIAEGSWFYRVNYKVGDIPFYCGEISKPQEKEFVNLLISEDFTDYEINDAANYVYSLQKKAPSAVKDWLLDLFFTFQDNEQVLLQLLRLLQCFPMEKLYPASLAIAGLGLRHNSDYVKSESLSMLDHWGRHPKVLKLIKNQDPPEAEWLKMKYIAIINALERK